MLSSHLQVGVAGRTGCGKSTLMMSLYRLVEPSGGRIIIDGINTASIGLQDLRSRLALVPQVCREGFPGKISLPPSFCLQAFDTIRGALHYIGRQYLPFVRQKLPPAAAAAAGALSFCRSEPFKILMLHCPVCVQSMPLQCSAAFGHASQPFGFLCLIGSAIHSH